MILISQSLFAQTSFKPFSILYQETQKGGVTLIGNTQLRANPITTSGFNMTDVPPSGGGGGTGQPNSTYIDIDADASTTNSTSADFALGGSCRTISQAFLYWSGNFKSYASLSAVSTFPGYINKNQVKLRVPGSAVYNVITADGFSEGSTATTAFGVFYECYKNVTSIVKAAGNGTYFMADIQSQIGANNNISGWALVVFYEDISLPNKQFTIFNGSIFINSGQSGTVTISGFQTPPVGPVGLDLGVIAYDGDRGSSTDDYLRFSSNIANMTNANYNLSNTLNPSTDFLNSSITNYNTNFTARNPNYGNTLGVDYDLITPNNTNNTLIGNNVTRAFLSSGSANEGYILTNFITAIENYEPVFDLTHNYEDLNGGNVNVGDEIKFTFTAYNTGNDYSALTYVDYELPPTVSLVANSITVTSGWNVGNKTDATGDDQVDYNSSTRKIVARMGIGANATQGGFIPNYTVVGNSTSFSYRVKVLDDCAALFCTGNQISSVGTLYFSGNITSVSGSQLSRPVTTSTGCSTSGPLVGTVIGVSCTLTPDMTVSGLSCPVDLTSIVTSPGYKFYDPSNNLVTTATIGGQYMAVRTITSTCSDIINILLINFTPCTPPVANPYTFVGIPGAAAATSIPGFTGTTAQGSITGFFINALPLASTGILYVNGIAATASQFVPNSLLGTLTFDPVNTFTGITSFNISARNSVGFVSTITSSYGISIINNAPTANGITLVTSNGVSMSYPLSPVHVSDLENGVLTYSIVSTLAGIGASPFNISINSTTGIFTYTSHPDATPRIDRITYRVCDNGVPIACSTAQISIRVPYSNLAPIPFDDNLTVNEDTRGIVTISGNDYDPNPQDVKYYAVLTAPGFGTFVLNSLTGVLTFNPNLNYNGTDVIGYRVCDSPAIFTSCGTAFVYINVLPVVDPLTAFPNFRTLLEDNIVTGNVITDATADFNSLTGGTSGLTATGFIGTFSGGNLTITGAGAYTFSPFANVNGTYAITYQVCNADICTTAGLFFTITGVIDRPTANPNYKVTVLNTPTTGNLITDATADFNPLTGGTTGLTTNAISTTIVGGQLDIVSTGDYSFVPNTGFTGTTSYTYTLCNADACTTSGLFLTVVGANTPPVAGTVTSGVITPGVLSSIPLMTGTDPDGSVTRYIVVSLPANGTLFDGTNAAIVVNSTLSGLQLTDLYFQPNATFTGNTSFTYRVIDNLNAVSSNLGLYNIDVNANGCLYTTVTYRDLSAGNVGVGNSIQLRVNVAVPANTTLFGASLFQEIPSGVSIIPGTIKLINPNGTTIAGYTDAAGDDAGQVVGSLVRINVGVGANATSGGNVIGNVSTPIFANTSFITLAVDVSVTGALGSVISTTGYATYKLSSLGTTLTCSGLSPIQIQISQTTTLCADESGPNMFTNVTSGTFGTGTGLNFGTITGTVYPYQTLTNSTPSDGNYSIVNSTDSNGSGTAGGGVFGGYWDIIGDHSNAANPILGNPPPTTGNAAGYMMVVNASYSPDIVISDNINNLCPDMNYEYSAWIRNVCSSCGGALGSGNPGVLPNLAFGIDGVDIYSTGDIAYTGQWQQVGFQYLTKPSQTSLTVRIRNNAPGGGGNDWALDDISFRSCIPIVTFNTGYSPTVCGASIQNFVATVTSKYNNFTSYKWQKSVDNGANWSDISSVITTTAALQGSNYIYNATLVGVNITLADNGAKYAIVVGTSAANVASSSCSFRSTVVNMQVVTLPSVNINTYIGNITTTACNLPTGIVLTASGGNAYRWSTNATTTSINVAATSVTGIYTVTATGTAQCTASKSVTILGMGLNPCNTPPTVTNVGVSIPRNAPVTTIPGLRGSDVDGAVAFYTISSLPNASYGTLYYCTPGCTAIATNGTTLTGVEAASLSFDPSGSYIGGLSFVFTATDNGGAVSTASGLYVITLTSANNAPTALNFTFSGFEDAPVLGSITGFADADGDNVTITSFNGALTNGLLTVLGTGAVRFVPDPNFNGINTYQYTVCDPFACTTANLVFSVSGVNDPPFVSATPVTISGPAGTPNVRSITGWGDIDTPLAQLTLSGLNPISVTPNGTVNTITGGTVTIGGQGLVTFQSSVPGIYSLNYQVCDPTVTCTSAVLTISVSGASPIPANDGFITDEKTSLSGGNLLSNDFNPNTNTSLTGLTLNTATTLLGANIGVLSVNGSGAFTFVPTTNLPQGLTTVTSYRYQVCNVSGCSTAQAVFSISGVNDPPFASSIPVTISGQAGGTNVRSITGWGDTDTPLAQLTLSGLNPVSVTPNGTVNTITGGTVTIGGQGLVTFQGSVPGIYSLNYQVCDPTITCTSAILTISVSGASPIPANDGFITNEKTSLSGGNLLANDLNPNTNTSLTGLTLNTATTLLGANIGVLSVNGSGTFTFVPTINLPQGVTTITSYRYQVCNVSGCSTAQAIFSVSGVNDAPVVNNYTISGTSGIAITGTLLLHQLNNNSPGSIYDVDNNPLTLLGVSNLVLTSTGNAIYQTTNNQLLTISGNGNVRYLSNTTFSGADSFTLRITDGIATTSGTIIINVSPSLALPIAVNDANSTNENSTVSGSVLTNDTNPLTGNNTGLTVTGVTNSPNGTVAITNSLTGAYVFTPNVPSLAQSINTVVGFTYTVCNTNGCSTAQIAITVTGVNNPPVVTINTLTGVNEDTRFCGNIVGYSDVDNVVTVTAGITTISGVGVVTINGNGSFCLDPEKDVNGGPKVIPFAVCDPFTCTSSNLVFTINGVNDAPVVNNYTISGVAGSPISGTLLLHQLNNNSPGSIYDVDNNPLTLLGVLNLVFTSTGSIVLPTTNNQLLTLSGNGSISYLSNTSFSGIDSFVLRITDGLATTTGTITIRVSVTGLGPIAVNDVNTTNENSTVSGNVLTNDINPITGTSAGLTVTGISSNPNGSVTITNSLTGAYVFTPNIPSLPQGVVTTLGFIYTVCNINSCTTAGITVSITGINNPPVVSVNTLIGVTEDTRFCGNIIGYSDVDNVVTVTAGISTISGVGVVTINGDGSFCLDPEKDIFGGPKLIPFTVCDPFTCTSSNLVFTITSVIDYPVAVNDMVVTDEDTPVSATIVGNDFNPLTGNNSGLTVTGFTGTISGGNITLTGNGILTFVPNQDFNGITNYTYTVCNTDACTTAGISISVTGVNDPPVAVVNTFLGFNEDDTFCGSITGFSDVDDNTTLTSGIFTTNDGGSITISGTGAFCFNPGQDVNGGPITFPYTVCGGSTCVTNDLLFTVNGVNDAPVVINLTINGAAGILLTNNFTIQQLYATAQGSIYDVDSSPLTLLGVSNLVLTSTGFIVLPTTNAQLLTISGNGAISYLSANTFTGVDTYSFVVTDGLLTTTGTLVFNIGSSLAGPSVTNDGFRGNENTTIVGNVLANDQNPLTGNNNGLTVTGVGTSTLGTLDLNTLTGAFSFIPAINIPRNTSTVTSISMTVCNVNSCVGSLLTITIDGVNDAPTAINLTFSGMEDMLIATSITGYFDIDGDALTFDLVTISGLASVSGTLFDRSYQPEKDFTGTATYQYRVFDGVAYSNIATVTISITGVNDPPVAVVNTFTGIDEGDTECFTITGYLDVDDSPSVTTGVFTTSSGAVITINSPDKVCINTSGMTDGGLVTYPYTVCGGGTCTSANMEFSVTGVNDAPTLVNDGFITTIGGILDMNVLVNDSDVDGSIVTTSVGIVMDIPATSGVLSVNSTTGVITFTPVNTFSGVVSFTYTACDNGSPLPSLCSTATGVITVTGNYPTTAVLNTFTGIDEDNIFCSNIYGASDPDDVLTVTAGIFTVSGGGSITISGSGAFCYDPGKDVFGGPFTFPYTVCGGNDCAVNDLVFTVNGINDAPTVSLTSVLGVVEKAVIEGTITGFSDVDNLLVDLTVSTVVGGLPKNGTITLTDKGVFTYVPFSTVTSGLDTLIYRVCDNGAPQRCTDGMLVFTITSRKLNVQLASVCIKDAAYVQWTITGENFDASALPAKLSWIDSLDRAVKVDSNLALTGQILWPGAVVDENGVGTDWPGWILNNGEWERGNDGFEATRPNVTVRFTVNPTQELIVNYPPPSEFCVVEPRLTTTSGNNPPVAGNATITGANEDTIYNGSITGISDPDGGILTVTAGVYTTSGGGLVTVSGSGAYVYLPPANFNGTDCFGFTVCDASGLCANGTECIVIAGVNDTPVAIRDVFTVPSNIANFKNDTSNTVLKNDFDIDGDMIKVVKMTNVVTPNGGMFSIDSTGRFTYSKPEGFAGKDSVMYLITDPSGAVDTAYIVFVIPFTRFIPDGFSPNGDGIFDTWKIQKPEGVRLKVEIFNRWGDAVYKADDFTEWNGSCNTGLKVGDDVPDGTYFYYVEYENSSESPRKGYITLSR